MIVQPFIDDPIDISETSSKSKITAIDEAELQ